MRSFILTILVVGAFAMNDELWQEWKRVHNKEYNDPNEQQRRDIWNKNVQRIIEHNLRYDLGLVNYMLGLNQFTDMTFDEFRAKYLFPMPITADTVVSDITMLEDTNDDVPDSIDWRTQGYVTPVKNQENCGSCWSFSTTGAVEGQYKRKYGNLTSFSEQQLVDCSGPFGNHGCNGGLMPNAYQYLAQYALEEESRYPYEARESSCRYQPAYGITKVDGYRGIPRGDENALKSLVGINGPAAVAIDVEESFMMYKNGVYRSESCSSRYLNHAVLAVGYGSENGQSYWIVKNSWGSWWGDEGYILMARNENNMCGIASLASVPNVNKV